MMTLYPCNGLTDQQEIWHDDAYWSYDCTDSENFVLLKIQYGGRPPFWKKGQTAIPRQ